MPMPGASPKSWSMDGNRPTRTYCRPSSWHRSRTINTKLEHDDCCNSFPCHRQCLSPMTMVRSSEWRLFTRPRDRVTSSLQNSMRSMYCRRCSDAQIGSRLLCHAIRWLSDRGQQSMLLWVLRDNPHRRFYDHLGGELLSEQKQNDFGGEVVTSVSYGWRDLEALEERLRRVPSAGRCAVRRPELQVHHRAD